MWSDSRTLCDGRAESLLYSNRLDPELAWQLCLLHKRHNTPSDESVKIIKLVVGQRNAESEIHL